MKIVIASNNQGKIKEFKELLPNCEVVTYEQIIGKIDIEEIGLTFQENAIIKAKAVYEKINEKDAVVIADDSGVSVKALNNEPNIYSARYAKIGASDNENNEKLIKKLKEKNLEKSNAFYSACIAIAFKDEIYTVHGFMYGDVITQQRGKNGFGYDPLFVPKGYEKTLGELNSDIKKNFSHRAKALSLAKIILDVII